MRLRLVKSINMYCDAIDVFIAGAGQYNSHAPAAAAAPAVPRGQGHCDHHPPALKPPLPAAGQAAATQPGESVGIVLCWPESLPDAVPCHNTVRLLSEFACLGMCICCYGNLNLLIASDACRGMPCTMGVAILPMSTLTS